MFFSLKYGVVLRFEIRSRVWQKPSFSPETIRYKDNTIKCISPGLRNAFDLVLLSANPRATGCMDNYFDIEISCNLYFLRLSAFSDSKAD